jgi:transcription initiation factor IIE alpha subunit|tara:strand:+ start:3244 stop:3531 length:288 start_codon:yes stop_codon:yes gene_type:complete
MTRNVTTSRPSKIAHVIKMLSRAKGATLEEIGTATGWQPHSCRAALTGLRKKGHILVREARNAEETAYRITAAEAATGPDAPPPEPSAAAEGTAS